MVLAIDIMICTLLTGWSMVLAIDIMMARVLKCIPSYSLRYGCISHEYSRGSAQVLKGVCRMDGKTVKIRLVHSVEVAIVA